MAIRVTQGTMYNDMVNQMQNSLSAYMNTVEQGSSQKKINRPSDDPAGMFRVLTTRDDIAATKQLQTNVDTAKGWLNLADDVLSNQVSSVITRLKALAEQASTGTYSPDQRMLMAEEARAYFGDLLNLANTEFEGKQLFGGHRYDSSSFVQELSATTWDEDWAANIGKGYASFAGSADKSVEVQFHQAGDIAAGSAYRWTNDGGKTWQDGVVTQDAKGNFVVDAGGATMTLRANDPDGNAIAWTAKQPEDGAFGGANNGTTLVIRPAAIYKGDDNDPPPDVNLMGAPVGMTATAAGDFGKDVFVRFDTAADLAQADKEFVWSYSTDGGANWVTAKGLTEDDGTLRLPVPGGYVDVDATALAAGDSVVTAGTQIQVHPARGDLKYEILEDTYISVNSVGKDVFGGLYDRIETWHADEGLYVPGLEGSENLFEVVGAFIGYLETNNQEGCQRTLAALDVADKKVLAEAARIGGLETRVEMAHDLLAFQKTDQEERLSYVEDIDLTELLNKMTRQQLTYQTVLQSSSMIMKLSLANYV